MNRLLVIVAVWIVVAGLIGGESIDGKAKRCDAPQRVTNADLAAWLVWPVLIVAAVTVDRDSVAYSPCEDKP